MATGFRFVLSLAMTIALTGCDRSPQDTEAAVAGDGSSAAPTASVTEPPLLPRDLLFGNPERANGQLSPDGRWLGYIAPRDGVLNVYVAPSDDPDAARPVTNDRLRGIRGFSFAYTNNHVLYAQDVGGDENFQVFAVDLTADTQKELSPTGSRASVAQRSIEYPNEVLVSVNDRDARYFDLVRVNLETGEQTRVFENDEFASVWTDDDFRLRFAAKQTTDGGQEVFIRDGDGWQSWATIPQADALTTQVVGITRDGNTIYMLDTRDRNTAALFAIDAATGERRLVHEDPRADIGGAIADPRTGEVQAVAVNYLRTEWTVVDPAIEADLTKLEAIGDGDVNVGSRTLADDKWVVTLTSSTQPPRVFLYDRAAGPTEHWFDVRPELANAATAPTEAQAAHMRGEADVDRQHPELAHHLQEPFFGRDRQRDEQQVDARAAREFHEIVDGAEFGHAAGGGRRAVIGAVVEQAADVQIGVLLCAQGVDQGGAGRSAADDDGAADEATHAGPVTDECGEREAPGE